MAKNRGSLLEKNNNKMNLVEIEPLTDNQDIAFEIWEDFEQNLLMYGYAGTGKSFLALYFALSLVMEPKSLYKKVVLIRSAVPSRDIGFLPGSQAEKASVYEEPYEKIVNTLLDRGDAYSILKRQGAIEFRTTSYMRGLTFDRTIVIVDECQNMTDGELNTLLTRIGEDTRFIICGDFRQNDLNQKKEKSGMKDIINILKRISTVGMVEFGIQDIVRSGFVKSYIIEREKYFEKTLQ